MDCVEIATQTHTFEYYHLGCVDFQKNVLNEAYAIYIYEITDLHKSVTVLTRAQN